MYLDTKQMHSDILVKLNRINQPQRYLTEVLDIQRATLYRLSLGKDITLRTFLILIKWLEKDADYYIKGNGKTKREQLSINKQCRSCGY